MEGHMGWVALRRFESAPGRWVSPGDLVPEAASWPNLRPWAGRFIALVIDGKEAEFAKAIAENPANGYKFLVPVNPRTLRAAGRAIRTQSGAGSDSQFVPPSDSAPAASDEAEPSLVNRLLQGHEEGAETAPAKHHRRGKAKHKDG